MAENHSMVSHFMVFLIISRLLSTVGKSKRPTPSVPYLMVSHLTASLIISRLLSKVGKPKPPTHSLLSKLAGKVCTDPKSISVASTDFGNIVRETPAAVFHPSCPEDIAALVWFSYNSDEDNSSIPFPIVARGRGHSVRGQATTRGGVVVDMTSLARHRGGGGPAIAGSSIRMLGHYADVSGGHLWRDVLEETLRHGLAPVSWTDYLYLTVGGTLSNAGISGQTFRHGPQISNVHEMDVITGMIATTFSDPILLFLILPVSLPLLSSRSELSYDIERVVVGNKYVLAMNLCFEGEFLWDTLM